MKTIGLLGGMSWESTATYYKMINQGIHAQLGGLHSAKLCMVSVDFDQIEKLQHNNQWNELAKILSKAAQSIESAGADFLLICTNTMHKVAHEVQQKINIPLFHIADATAHQLIKDGITKVGLLGTAFTMKETFYKNRLTEQFGIEVVVPNEKDCSIVHNIIYNELCLGEIKASSNQKYLNIIDKLNQRGAQAVILGCTEIGLLINQDQSEHKLYDTTEIHAQYAVTKALNMS